MRPISDSSRSAYSTPAAASATCAAPVREFFPHARYVGLETSEYLCRRYGWVREGIADHAPAEPFDLVICHDVLQYVEDDRAASRAIRNLGKLAAARSISAS